MGGKKKRVGMRGNVLEVRDYNMYITELIGKRKTVLRACQARSEVNQAVKQLQLQN